MYFVVFLDVLKLINDVWFYVLTLNYDIWLPYSSNLPDKVYLTPLFLICQKNYQRLTSALHYGMTHTLFQPLLWCQYIHTQALTVIPAIGMFYLCCIYRYIDTGPSIYNCLYDMYMHLYVIQRETEAGTKKKKKKLLAGSLKTIRPDSCWVLTQY